jgi:hypothetical protein
VTNHTFTAQGGSALVRHRGMSLSDGPGTQAGYAVWSFRPCCKRGGLRASGSAQGLPHERPSEANSGRWRSPPAFSARWVSLFRQRRHVRFFGDTAGLVARPIDPAAVRRGTAGAVPQRIARMRLLKRRPASAA